MADVSEIVGDINKEYGAKVVGAGMDWSEGDRIPTGWFPFDLATGGGFPMGGVSVIFGPESSCKTSVALRAIAQCQQLKPHLKCVFLDLEGAYEPDWGKQLGVNNDALVYALPEYAEQAVDITTALLQADDIGLIVIDSLAAMSPENEIISSSEKASVGGAGLIISKFYRKLTTCMNQAKKQGRFPLVIAINQIRHKVGVMYGSPETQPGGFAFKFASKLTVRLYGKDVEDKTLSTAMPVFKEIAGEVRKWKVPICAKAFKMQMATAEIPGKLTLGNVDSWNTVSTYLKNYGWLHKDKQSGPWLLFGDEYKTLNLLRYRLAVEVDYRNDIESRIIAQARKPVDVIAPK
jgi:recombination protein RecA